MLLTILRIILIIFAWLNLIEEKPERKSEKVLWITIIVTTVVELVYSFSEYINGEQQVMRFNMSENEVGNGSRHTLERVPEMMDTPPIHFQAF